MASYIALFIFVAIVIAVIVFFAMRHSKMKSSAWRGTVVDKGTREHVRNNSVSRRNTQQNAPRPTLTIGNVSIGQAQVGNLAHISVTYYVVVKTEEGNELYWNISEGLYEKVQIGDILEKSSGSLIPMITTPTASTSPSTSQS